MESVTDITTMSNIARLNILKQVVHFTQHTLKLKTFFF